MSVYLADNGDIHLFRGDSGNITFRGLPTDKNYGVYFAVTDASTGAFVGDEISVNSNNSDTVTMTLSSDFTDKLTIGENDTVAVYRYGLKICYGSDEYTLIPRVTFSDGSPIFKNAPKIIVHRKFVEGL